MVRSCISPAATAGDLFERAHRTCIAEREDTPKQAIYEAMWRDWFANESKTQPKISAVLNSKPQPSLADTSGGRLIGHSTPMAGSFQAMQRSCSGA